MYPPLPRFLDGMFFWFSTYFSNSTFSVSLTSLSLYLSPNRLMFPQDSTPDLLGHKLLFPAWTGYVHLALSHTIWSKIWPSPNLLARSNPPQWVKPTQSYRLQSWIHSLISQSVTTAYHTSFSVAQVHPPHPGLPMAPQPLVSPTPVNSCLCHQVNSFISYPS